MRKLYYPLIAMLLLLGSNTFGQDLEKLDAKDEVKGFFKDFKEADPFKISGSVGLNMRSYYAFNTDKRQAPYTWYLNGNFNISIYKIKIPFSVLLSAQNQTISHPFHQETFDNFLDNRFTRIGASPYYKWVKLHLGHRSMNFSPFTVSNHTFLGGGVELTPGKVRFATFYGKMAKTEPRDLSLFGYNREVFSRKGFGVKTGYGTDKTFIDFILFKAKDDPNQLDLLNQDSATVFRNDNAVLGINGKATLFEKLTLNLELASSGFTKNIDDPINLNTSASMPEFLLKERTSTDYRQAINAGMTFREKAFSIGMGYKRIEPDYRSLGAYFFNNDIEDYTVNLGFGLLKNRLRFNGTGGLQKNNLFGGKATQLNRTIGSASVNYFHNTLNVGLTYSNYTSEIDFVLNAELDSLNAIVVNQNASLNASYSKLSKTDDRHLFAANFSVQQVTDDVENPNRSAESKMINAVLTYSFSPKVSGWRFNSRVNYNNNELSRMRINRYGLGLGVERSLVPEIWSISLNTNYFYSDGETVDSQTFNARLNSPVRINKHHRVDLGLLFLNRFKSSNNANRSFQELTIIANYVYSF